MTFRRRPGPDVFELMIFARTRVFVRVDDHQYQVVTALEHHLSILTFCVGNFEPVSIRYIDDQPVGLFDGKAWDLPALIKWLNSLEE